MALAALEIEQRVIKGREMAYQILDNNWIWIFEWNAKSPLQ